MDRMENKDISEGELETYGCFPVGARETVEGFFGRLLSAGSEYVNSSRDTSISRENPTECDGKVNEDSQPGSRVSDGFGAEGISNEAFLSSCYGVGKGRTVSDVVYDIRNLLSREHILRSVQENDRLKIIAQTSQRIFSACQNVNLEKIKTNALVKTGYLFNSVSQLIGSALHPAEKVPEVADEEQRDFKDDVILSSGQDGKPAETEEGGRVGYPEGEKYPAMADDELDEFEDCVTEISDGKLGEIPDELSTVDGRKATFLNASDELKTVAHQLAEAGFFVIKGRTVKCLDCAALHYNCEPVRDPTNHIWPREGCGIVRRSVQDRGRVAERSRDRNHPRTRSLTVPHQISSAGREGDNMEGAVGYVSRERMRSSSVPPESDLPAKCRNCNQNPMEEAEKVELPRSVPVQRICYYCREQKDDVDICIRTQRHVCHGEECRKKLSRCKKATAEE